MVYDPARHLGEAALHAFELRGDLYVPIQPWFEPPGLGLVEWDGEFEGMGGPWLRWRREDGSVLRTGAERAESERKRAESERKRAEDAEARVQRLAARPIASCSARVDHVGPRARGERSSPSGVWPQRGPLLPGCCQWPLDRHPDYRPDEAVEDFSRPSAHPPNTHAFSAVLLAPSSPPTRVAAARRKVLPVRALRPAS